MWQLKPDIMSKVRVPLLQPAAECAGTRHIRLVFCRNVLIYFDQPTKARVLDLIASTMRDDGVLFLGGAETVFGISETFKPLPGQHGVYALAASGKAAA